MKSFIDLAKQRRSVRLLSGEQITKEELEVLLEAMRWAPSSFNDQPWRIIYALRDTEKWKTFLEFLKEGNRKWVSKGGVIFIVLAKKFLDYKHKVARHHWFDCGGACQNLSLQATELGLSACALGGFNEDVVRKSLSIPSDFDIPVMMVAGWPRQGLLEKLTSSRKSIAEISSEGTFLDKWNKKL